MKITGTEPAYPVGGNSGLNGLTVRQQFAMAAMQGLCANPEYINWPDGKVASMAVFEADQLIAELNKEES